MRANTDMDLMALLSGGMDEPEQEVDPATAREMLTDAYAKLMQEHRFVPAQIVRLKRGLESGSKNPSGGLMVFIRYAQPSEGNVPHSGVGGGEPANRMFYDCIAGRLADGALLQVWQNSEYLEPAHD